MRAALYTAAWVLPVSSPPIHDGAVLVDERGRIAAVAPVSALSVGDDVARIELGDAILLPGLINVHAHPELTGMRGLLEDLPFHRWIPALRRTKDEARLALADHVTAARWGCLEAIAAGITTVAATEESAASLAAFRDSGLRGIVFFELFGPAPEQAETVLARIRERIEAARQLESERVRVGISPHAPYTVSDDLYRFAADYATTERLPLATHIAESEVELQLLEHGGGPFAAGLRTRGIATPPRAATAIALLQRTGVLAARPLLIHCVYLTPDDIRVVADAGATVAHCPIANARLGHGVAPLIELLEAGITVGLGTDSVAANNRVDLIEEARTAQLMQRARLRSAGALPPARLLELMTIDGARALSMEARIGSLQPGKDADLCAVRLTAAHTRPVTDPVATLLLSARGSDVVLTVVGGEVLYHNGHFRTLDPDELRDCIDELGTRLYEARQRCRDA
jgi:cytosine/adenosine deaminase-related metal-dependent hydrolase